MKPNRAQDPDLAKMEARRRAVRVAELHKYIASQTNVIPHHILNGSHNVAVAWKKVAAEAVRVDKTENLAKMEAAAAALQSFYPCAA